jgi:hypothetical protein
MNSLRLACILAIAGGALWVLRFLLTVNSGDEGSPVFFWAGAVLLTVMGALAAVNAVRRAPVWLRLVVGVSGPLAGWMVLIAAYGPADTADVRRAAVDGIVGALGILVGLLSWRAGKSQSRHRGSHTA